MANNFMKYLEKIKNFKPKQIITILGVIIILILGGWFLFKVIKPAPKQIYEVAIWVRSQSNPDPVEDRKNSNKAGDVLVVQPEGHNWSQNEKISYLILKMELTEAQKQKLTAPEEREIKFDELSSEEQERIEEEKKRAKEEDREYVEEPRREVLRARAYHIPLNQKEFANFKAIDLMQGQPFQDKIYDWGIVEKKESVE